MPLTRFLQNTAFGPEEVALLVAAYEAALRELDLSGRADPVTEIVAKKIIELAKEGERDPHCLRIRAIEALRDVPPNAAAGP